MPEPMVSGEVMRNLLYSGSVKDVYGIAGRDPYVFDFSNRYSIFDWGEMPDALPMKGEALAVMGDLFFRQLAKTECWSQWQIHDRYPKFWRDSFTTSALFQELRRSGLNHHSFGLVSEAGEALLPGKISKHLAVRALERPAVRTEMRDGKIHYDYSAYAERPPNCLVPLEVVFRFGAPEGSSFLSRAESIPGYGQSFGFSEKVVPGEMFPYPIVEFFTKLEPTDRYLSRDEAVEVGALRQDELDDLVTLTLLVALRLRDIFAPLGLELWDGKFEFAFQPGAGSRRGFMLVDSIGPDELRLIGPGGVHFSKEFLRRVYRGAPWHLAMEKAKKVAKDRGEKDWKRICREELKQLPERLPPEVLACAQEMYPALANELSRAFIGSEIFEQASGVAALCQRIKGVL